jgi:hypothetical protein
MFADAAIYALKYGSTAAMDSARACCVTDELAGVGYDWHRDDLAGSGLDLDMCPWQDGALTLAPL